MDHYQGYDAHEPSPGEGQLTPTSTAQPDDQTITITQQLQITPEVIPVYLARLMADYARQLRRAQGDGAPDGGSSTVTDGSRSTVTITPSPSSTSGFATAPLSRSPSTLPSSAATDLSPRPFSHLTGSGNATQGGAALPPLVLPKAALDSTATAAAAAGSAQAAAAAGGAVMASTSGGGSAVTTYTPNRRLEDVYSPPKQIAPEEDLLPPDNFAMVASFIYRSSFPKRKNFPFLRSLGLKSVLTLILEDYPEANSEFLEAEGIKFFQFGIPGNKEPFVQIPEDKIVGALALMLDTRNHPMLIHCNKGKHRTGCLIGCLRKVQQWSLTQIFSEYRLYSYPKSRSMDQQFIEAFAGLPDVWDSVDGRYLPSWALPSSTGM